MKTSVLIVMLDFLVCSLLLFVIGTGGKQTQFATSSSASTARVHEEFSPAAMQSQQEEWNRDYEQQSLLNQLNTTTTENEQLRGRLTETSATLAQREANLKAVTEENARAEQAKAQTEQALSKVSSQLASVSAEREKLQQEGEATKETLAKLQTEQNRLQQERSQLAQQAQQLGQTVASQQATINTLSQDVLASQARVESQVTDVAKEQQAMNTTLEQLDVFARTLPATIQRSVGEVRSDQQAMQNNLAAMAEDVKGLQAGLNGDEKGGLMQTIAEVAKGQQDIQAQLDALMKNNQSDQIDKNLVAIQNGQNSLRDQAAKLGEQIESLKAHGPGPYKAVRGARLVLQVHIAKQDSNVSPTEHFRSTAYPPVVNVAGRSFVVANEQTLGFNWWDLGDQGEVTQIKYAITRAGDPPWSGVLTAPACALNANPHVIAIELNQTIPGLGAMELAGPDAPLQIDQRKLHVFKSTAAGLSFEADTSPDLADPHYLVVKRQLRGVAAWFENPANRADVGDYVVTADGKLVGIMVTRERCFILSKDTLLNCAATVPLNNGTQFQRSIINLHRLK